MKSYNPNYSGVIGLTFTRWPEIQPPKEYLWYTYNSYVFVMIHCLLTGLIYQLKRGCAIFLSAFMQDIFTSRFLFTFAVFLSVASLCLYCSRKKQRFQCLNVAIDEKLVLNGILTRYHVNSVGDLQHIEEFSEEFQLNVCVLNVIDCCPYPNCLCKGPCLALSLSESEWSEDVASQDRHVFLPRE